MARFKKSERDEALKDTRRQLLETAAEEVARQGYGGANVNRISLAAGFAKGTLYNYFPSKHALMLALIDQIAEAHYLFILAGVEGEADPERRLTRFFESGFDFVSTHKAQAQVMVNTLFGPHADFKQYMYQAYQPMFDLVSEQILSAGIDQGVFRPVDPETTAALLMTIYLGSGSQVDASGRPWLNPGHVAAFSLRALRQDQW